jgi:hypothetical protein
LNNLPFRGVSLVLTAVLVTIHILASCGRSDNGFGCVSQTWNLAKNAAGDSIDEKITACGGVAFSSVSSLELLKRNAGAAVTFLSYEDSGFEPDVQWVGNNEIQVSIFQMDSMSIMRDRVDGVTVKYKIGTSYESVQQLYNECDSHAESDRQRCLQFILAVMSENNGPPRNEYCVPQGTVAGHIVETTKRWVELHADKKTASAAILVRRALASAYSCKSGEKN